MSGPAQQTVVNRKAIYSAACGALAFAAIYLTPFAGLLVALPSISSAIHARREIVESKGRQTGETWAFTGLLLGGGAIVTVVLAWAAPTFRG